MFSCFSHFIRRFQFDPDIVFANPTCNFSQRSSKITAKSCDPTLLSEENIIYKNPYSTFYSKMTFWWMSSLLWKGFFKALELNDLGNLSENDSSRFHYDQFLFIYQGTKVRSKNFSTTTFQTLLRISLNTA